MLLKKFNFHQRLTVHCVSLAFIVAWVPGQEELEVVVRVLDGADLVFLVDEVPGKR